MREQDSIDYTEGLYGGYAQSKWVAEKLVKVAGSRGLPFSIYRPGIITGHSQTGICNPDELICKIIQACIQLGSAPDVEMMLGNLLKML